MPSSRHAHEKERLRKSAPLSGCTASGNPAASHDAAISRSFNQETLVVDRVQHAEAKGDARRLVHRQMKSHDHAGEHVDGERQPRSLVHLPSLFHRPGKHRPRCGRSARLRAVAMPDTDLGTAFVALTPFTSLRFKATVRRSIRSTRALIVRRSGTRKPFARDAPAHARLRLSVRLC